MLRRRFTRADAPLLEGESLFGDATVCPFARPSDAKSVLARGAGFHYAEFKRVLPQSLPAGRSLQRRRSEALCLRAYPKTGGDCPIFAQSSEQNGTVPFSEARGGSACCCWP
jgi:hypothetical protein